MNRKAVAPPEWEESVKKMKKHPEIDNPWALAWSMKNKGYTPGGKDKKADMDALTTFQDALLARVAKEFPSDKARRDYLHDHPKADPKDHTVQKTAPKPKGKGKDVSDQEGFEGLKGLSHADQQKAIQRALKQEKDDAATEDRGRRREKVKNKDTEDILKGLSPEARKRVLERALKMAGSDALANFQDALLARRVARRVMGFEHPTEEARKKYLKDHPGAKPSDHSVEKKDDKGSKSDDFMSMSMDDLRKAVGKKIPGSKYDQGRMVLDLKDGQSVMFGRQGRGSSAKTTLDIYQGQKKIKTVAVKSVADAVSKLEGLQEGKKAPAKPSNHTVKKQKEEPKREKNEWAQAADQVAKEQVKGVGSHMAPHGVVPLKDDKHDAPGIAKDHTRKQIEESLSNVKARMKYLNISDEPPKGMSEDEAEDDKYTDEKQGGSWRKTKKTLEKALKLKGDKDD